MANYRVCELGVCPPIKVIFGREYGVCPLKDECPSEGPCGYAMTRRIIREIDRSPATSK